MLRLHCFLLALLLSQNVTGFAPTTPTSIAPCRRQDPLAALTERQMQFWEDVEDGLKDIEVFYEKKGMGSIDRIWGFCQRYVNSLCQN